MTLEQLDLIKKTEEELEASIFKKRKEQGPNAKLDTEEEALLIKQMHEEQEDRNNTYPH